MSDRALAISLGAGACVVYLATGFGLLTDYDYYGRLAQAFLAGHYWLTEAPPWLNELLACGDGRWCVAYPPLPAVLAMPFAAVLPPAVAQVLVSRLAAGVSAGVLYLGLRALGAPRAVAIAGTVLSAVGTTLFFSSVDGRAWFDAHAVAMPFLCASAPTRSPAAASSSAAFSSIIARGVVAVATTSSGCGVTETPAGSFMSDT